MTALAAQLMEWNEQFKSNIDELIFVAIEVA